MKQKDLENTTGKTVEDSSVIGQATKFMEKENFIGQMVANMKANMNLIKSMDMVHSILKMVGNLREIGNMEIWMGKV